MDDTHIVETQHIVSQKKGDTTYRVSTKLVYATNKLNNMTELYKNQYRTTSARLKHADYGNGVYFVTICTKDKTNYFGEIMGTEGEINNSYIYHKTSICEHAEKCISEIPSFHPAVSIIEKVVMPNHVHILLYINNGVEANNNVFGSQSMNLASVIRGFKSAVTTFAKKNGIEFTWQPGYYDRIVRPEEPIEDYIKYIQNNPLRWAINKGTS